VTDDETSLLASVRVTLTKRPHPPREARRERRRSSWLTSVKNAHETRAHAAGPGHMRHLSPDGTCPLGHVYHARRANGLPARPCYHRRGPSRDRDSGPVRVGAICRQEVE